VVKLRIVVEGGEKGKDLRSKCRKGFKEFFVKAKAIENNFIVVASGARGEAFKDFKTELKNKKSNEEVILLIDSEGPIAEESVIWDFLKKMDGWDRPRDAGEDNVHLMVQSMESWFMVDKEELEKYYGNGFHSNSLPQNVRIEEIPKEDVVKGLNAAAKETPKEKYEKGRDSFEILAKINSENFENAQDAFFAKRVIKFVRNATQ